MPDQSYDIGIVGAGVAGTAFAAHLADLTGLRIALIERSWEEPDEIIGELLQPDGVLKLEEMGLGHVFSEINAHPVHGYAVYLNGKHYGLKYPKDASRNIRGYGFRYGRFVGALRKAAKSKSNLQCIQGTVTHLLENGDGRIKGVQYKNHSGELESLSCVLTVLCPGSISGLRTTLHRENPSGEGFMAGILINDCDLPYTASGHVILGDPAPVLAYPVGPRKIRILVDFPVESQVKGKDAIMHHLRNVTTHQLPEELKQGFTEALRKESFKVKGTFQMPAKPQHQDGVLLLGDSLNMRHPLTGAGMTVALTDIRNLVSEIANIDLQTDPSSLDSVVKKFYRERTSTSATMNIMALALYKSFKHPELRQACFDYLSSGGRKSEGPMSLISGVSRNRGLLLKHFFAVGFSAVGKALKPFPSPGRIRHSFNILITTLVIILPLLRDESSQFNRS